MSVLRATRAPLLNEGDALLIRTLAGSLGMTLSQLAQHAGRSKRTLQRRLPALVAADFVSVERRSGPKPNIYRRVTPRNARYDKAAELAEILRATGTEGPTNTARSRHARGGLDPFLSRLEVPGDPPTAVVEVNGPPGNLTPEKSLKVVSSESVSDERQSPGQRPLKDRPGAPTPTDAGLVIAELLDFGLTYAEAATLVVRHRPAYVAQKIAMTRDLQAQKSHLIEPDAGRYLRRAIDRDYCPAVKAQAASMAPKATVNAEPSAEMASLWDATRTLMAQRFNRLAMAHVWAHTTLVDVAGSLAILRPGRAGAGSVTPYLAQVSACLTEAAGYKLNAVLSDLPP